MHSFKEQRIMPYNFELIKDIIMDIEKYPDFLPWCDHATILSKTDQYITAELTVSFKSFSENYISKVLLEKNNDEYIIQAEAISGPFEYLQNIWNIKRHNNASIVNFSIDFQFKSKILNKLIGIVFSKATEKMIAAFEERAKNLSQV